VYLTTAILVRNTVSSDWVILLYRIENIRKEVAAAYLKVLRFYMV